MSKQISELESQIMNIVWELKRCSVRDTVDNLKTQKKLAYTTVATILQRLYEKGLVKREEDKLAILYSPKVSKESYSKKIAKVITNNFFNTFGDIGIASFADSIDKLPKEKKKYLLRLLNNRNETK